MLQAEHLPLAEIRERLAAMSDAQVELAVRHGEASRGVTRRAPATE
jgi:hypothetical protein